MFRNIVKNKVLLSLIEIEIEIQKFEIRNSRFKNSRFEIRDSRKLEIEKMDTVVLIEQGMMVLMSGMSGILIFCVREGITIQKI